MVCPRKKRVSVVKNWQGYYPFGLTFNEWTSTNPRNQYTYNGFEEQAEWGVLDYGARSYDANLGRFLQVDPAADMYFAFSPMSYSYNNPISFLDPDGMMVESAGNTDPKKLYGKTIDMSGAPGSKVNAAGHPRNGPWFWRQMLKNNPEMFDDANRIRINSNQSPHINETWIKHNPSHASYKGKLVHHHIDQGKIATGIPQSAHRQFNKQLHPNRGGRGKLKGIKGIGGALSVASFLLDLFNSDPHSMGMLLRASNDLNTLYYDTDSNQYYEITDRNEIKDDTGNVIGRETTYTVYSDYYYDEDAGKYVGTGESKTYKTTEVSNIEEAYEVLGIH